MKILKKQIIVVERISKCLHVVVKTKRVDLNISSLLPIVRLFGHRDPVSVLYDEKSTLAQGLKTCVPVPSPVNSPGISGISLGLILVLCAVNVGFLSSQGLPTLFSKVINEKIGEVLPALEKQPCVFCV